MREELLIEEIMPTKSALHLQLKIRRLFTTEEKIERMTTLIRSYVNPHYSSGRVVYMQVDLNYIEKHDVTVGDDINSYDDLSYKVMVMESVNKGTFEEEGLLCTVKKNPRTKEPMTHNGKTIYRATFLIPEESYSGDIILNNDKK